MKAEYINAFIEATLETFQSMCSLSFKRTGTIKRVGGEIVEVDDLMAICGLSGDVKGAVMLTTPLQTGMKLVGAFLMEELTVVNCDLMDGWGEIVNIIAGAADAKISDLRIDLSLPSVLLGKSARFYAKAGNPFVVVPMFIPDVGPFSLGISMEIKKK